MVWSLFGHRTRLGAKCQSTSGGQVKVLGERSHPLGEPFLRLGAILDPQVVSKGMNFVVMLL